MFNAGNTQIWSAPAERSGDGAFYRGKNVTSGKRRGARILASRRTPHGLRIENANFAIHRISLKNISHYTSIALLMG